MESTSLSMIVNLTDILPETLLRDYTVSARELYGPHRKGWVSCLFRNWPDSSDRTPDHELLVPLSWDRRNLEAGDFWAVTLILEGNAEIRFGSAPTRSVGPGSLIRFYGFDREAILQGRPGLRECSFAMEQRTARRLEDVGLLQFENRLEERPLTLGRIMAFLDLFQELGKAAYSTSFILRKCIHFLDRIEATPVLPSNSDWVRQACELLETRIDPGFSMTEAARILKVDYDVFRKQFREQMGVSPIQYQMEARMRLGQHMLDRRTVKETAYLLGYEDPFLFSRQFKKFTGVPPSKFLH